jgi:hypothetical protein
MKPFRSICLLPVSILPTMAIAKSSRSCGEVKMRAAGRYAACFARADVALRSEGTGSRSTLFWEPTGSPSSAEAGPGGTRTTGDSSTSRARASDSATAFFIPDSAKPTARARSTRRACPRAWTEDTCGEHGNEKVFSADQHVSDCGGNLADPLVQGSFVLATETCRLGADLALYRVRVCRGRTPGAEPADGAPGGATPGSGRAPLLPSGPPTWSYAGYRCDWKVSRDEFYATLAETRDECSMLESDSCGYDSGSVSSGVTCDEHVGEPTEP